MEDMPDQTTGVNMDRDFLCAQHNENLKKVNESLVRGDERMERIEDALTQNQSAMIELLRMQGEQIKTLEKRQDVVEENQNNEVKYWRLAKRILNYTGIPAIIGWIIYLASFFKSNP